MNYGTSLAFCAAHDDDMLEDEDYEHGRSVVTALAPYREQFEQQVLQCLENPDKCTGWLEVFLVRLAGEMKLEAAISLLTDHSTTQKQLRATKPFEHWKKLATMRSFENYPGVMPMVIAVFGSPQPASWKKSTPISVCRPVSTCWCMNKMSWNEVNFWKQC